jgi:hypothetical protein
LAGKEKTAMMTKTPDHSGKGARKSSAVRSMEREQRSQKEKGQELERGLQETFPASDPVSPTSSTTSGAPQDKKG